VPARGEKIGELICPRPGLHSWVLMESHLLRYSDRKRLAEAGALPPLSYDVVPEPMRNAVAYIVRSLRAKSAYAVSHPSHLAYERIRSEITQHMGLDKPPGDLDAWFSRAPIEDFLDGLEIVAEVGRVSWTVSGTKHVPLRDIVDRLNRLCVRHRLGYQLDADGRVRRVGSPALDEYVVQPALQAVHRLGWEHAERSFREALQHQRGGPDERDDALTAATAALEAALKAAGLKGDRLSALAKSLRNSDLVPGQLKEVPEALDTLLKRSGAIRDPLSDAHGKAPGAPNVPEELVDLSIYWTGAFINYLAAATDPSAQ
jgi:hypothetical protein